MNSAVGLANLKYISVSLGACYVSVLGYMIPTLAQEDT